MKRFKSVMANIALVLVSSLIGLICFEIAWSYLKPDYVNTHTHKYVFLHGERGVFRNVENFYLYRENSVIRNATYFDTRDGWKKEYEYGYSTNNYGLVQKSDIHPGRSTLLILGDSFTEGSGAEPWFESLVPRYLQLNVQPVNGGIMGTGFAQWLLLHDYLKRQDIRIEKVIVVFISDDFRRDVWNFQDTVLQCLSDYEKCEGPEYYYQMPPEAQRVEFLERIKAFRESRQISHSAKETLRRLFPATSEIGYRLVRAKAAIALPSRFYPGYHPVEYFIETYGRNVIFVHIPQRDEVGMEPNNIGKMARDVIRSKGGQFYDGFQQCGLEPSDYYLHDNHPNEKGYRKISECVFDASRMLF